MGNVWGKNITVTIFGESHGPAIGVTLGSLPHGIAIDWAGVTRELSRRAPGGALSTPRKEADAFEVLSGVFNGHTTGAPLTAIIRNNDARSGDYDADVMRPGHADWTARVKYGGYNDYRGGGHFSGRLTAPLVFAGAIAKQVLARHGIAIGACIAKIAGIADSPAEPDAIIAASNLAFPVVDAASGEQMQAAIQAAREARDSVGGVVECVATGVPVGLGEPFFDSVESAVAHLLFSIPAVKGVEFGGGFALSDMRGSQANDGMYLGNGAVAFASNNAGGILGGITSGQPIIVRAAVKPTPTIGLPQTTVDLAAHETVLAEFGGRHDPCIVPRAVPVVEACLALCLLDFLA